MLLHLRRRWYPLYPNDKEDNFVENENLDIRLKAIELAVVRLATSITAHGGEASKSLDWHIQYFRERLGRGDLEPQQALIYEQTLALLDPLSPKPGDEF
jgi:hypothetical protein